MNQEIVSRSLDSMAKIITHATILICIGFLGFLTGIAVRFFGE